MKRLNVFRWVVLVAVNGLVLCMLSFNQATSATPGAPDADARKPDIAERQRAEMIIQLRQINAALKNLVIERHTGALPMQPPSTTD